MADEKILIENSAKYNELIDPKSEFMKLIFEFSAEFNNPGSIWYIPNFNKINSDNDISIYLSRSFINKYINKDFNKNYEFYEAVGDKLLQSAFMSYIILKFPETKTPKGVNLAFNNYMSRSYQAELTNKYILNYESIMNKLILNNQYTRLTNNAKNALAEDIFESIMGAIYIWSEKKCPASGIIYINKILKIIIDTNGGITEPDTIRENDIALLEKLIKELSVTKNITYTKPSFVSQSKAIMKCIVTFYLTNNGRAIRYSTDVTLDYENDDNVMKNKLASAMIEKLKSIGFSIERINQIGRDRRLEENKLIENILNTIRTKNIKAIENTNKRQYETSNKYIQILIDDKNLTITQYYSYIYEGKTYELSSTANTRILALTDLLNKTLSLNV